MAERIFGQTQMDSYKVALLLIRLSGLLYLVAGLAMLSAAILAGLGQVFFAQRLGATAFEAAVGWFSMYASINLVTAPAILFFSRRLAKLAAKYCGPTLNPG